MKRFPVLALLLAAACSSQSRPKAPPPVAAGAPLTPTPGIQSRIDPNVIEETDTYVIRRLPKSEYIRVDDRHIRQPRVTQPFEFFKEDDQYYYVSTPKALPEEIELRRQSRQALAAPGPAGTPAPGMMPAPPRASQAEASLGVTAADFAELSPPRVSGRLKLERVADPGLPAKGMWRASFAVADVNGDGIPDIVAPPPRLGDGQLRVWLGNGKGAFTPWKLSFTENGKPLSQFAIDYGGVAVGDIDGDGHADIVCASHGAGLVSLFGDGKGGFEVVRAGLPKRDFSTQAVALLDADGDGKLDLVASRDLPNSSTGRVDMQQVRLYLFLGRSKGWEFKKDGVVAGLFSNALVAWDYNRDGKPDILTGSHFVGALSLLSKNMGDGTFKDDVFKDLQPYAYHFSVAVGTWGAAKAPAFAEGYSAQANVPDTRRASGVNVYSLEGETWTRRPVWRKPDFKAYLFALAFGDLDGDGLDDIVLPDGGSGRLRVFFQQPDGSFVEAAESEEPALDSPPQCVRLADLDGDGRLDIVLSKTVVTEDPRSSGGWEIHLNRH